MWSKSGFKTGFKSVLALSLSLFKEAPQYGLFRNSVTFKNIRYAILYKLYGPYDIVHTKV